jgi:hypothetical protein
MEHSKLSFIRTNKRILQKEKIYNKRKKKNKYLKIFLCFGLTILFCVNILFFIFIILFQKKSSNNKGIKYIINKNNIKNNQIVNENSIDNNKNNENEQYINPNCTKLDPILIFSQRLKNGPITICDNGDSNHICYQNLNGYYNDIFLNRNGVICKMKNIILDPGKSEQSRYIYNGPVDKYTLGGPILNSGFFNMKCDKPQMLGDYYSLYNSYFSGWNYNYENNKDEKIEELAPGKTIFFLSRNQDSPNLYHGMTDILAIISMMDLFNINEDNAQIIFLESMYLKYDPYYEIYKKVLSRGGEPIFIKDLKQKYHISSAIHVPLNWDSPVFIRDVNESYCHNPTKTYKILLDLIDKYLDIQNYTDSFISDNETFYYPKLIIDRHNSGVKFIKCVTIQWRKVWPKTRTEQDRLMQNGPELADKLASVVPENILIRLVNTASLSMTEQISLMKKTDYLVGIHGAGLTLGIFMPLSSIYHEILPKDHWNLVQFMSMMSGHNFYFDIVKGEYNKTDGFEYIFLDENDFVEKVTKHMRENNYFQ